MQNASKTLHRNTLDHTAIW